MQRSPSDRSSGPFGAPTQAAPLAAARRWPFGRQRGNATVPGIDDQRGPARAGHRRALVPPEVVVGRLDVVVGILVAGVLVAGLDNLLRVLGRFGGGQEFLVPELRGALERRRRREAPDALQIGLAIGVTSGRRPRLRLHRRGVLGAALELWAGRTNRRSHGHRGRPVPLQCIANVS